MERVRDNDTTAIMRYTAVDLYGLRSFGSWDGLLLQLTASAAHTDYGLPVSLIGLWVRLNDTYNNYNVMCKDGSNMLNSKHNAIPFTLVESLVFDALVPLELAILRRAGCLGRVVKLRKGLSVKLCSEADAGTAKAEPLNSGLMSP